MELGVDVHNQSSGSRLPDCQKDALETFNYVAGTGSVESFKPSSGGNTATYRLL